MVAGGRPPLLRVGSTCFLAWSVLASVAFWSTTAPLFYLAIFPPPIFPFSLISEGFLARWDFPMSLRRRLGHPSSPVTPHPPHPIHLLCEWVSLLSDPDSGQTKPLHRTVVPPPPSLIFFCPSMLSNRILGASFAFFFPNTGLSNGFSPLSVNWWFRFRLRSPLFPGEAPTGFFPCASRALEVIFFFFQCASFSLFLPPPLAPLLCLAFLNAKPPSLQLRFFTFFTFGSALLCDLSLAFTPLPHHPCATLPRAASYFLLPFFPSHSVLSLPFGLHSSARVLSPLFSAYLFFLRSSPTL